MTYDSLDKSLELVANKRRRRVIRQLRRASSGETAVGDLAERLRHDEAFGGRSADRDAVALQLFHQHLPKLDAHGVVEYDAERARIRYRGDETVEAVLDSLPKDKTATNR